MQSPHFSSDSELDPDDVLAQQALSEALEGEPRADELQRMANTLIERFHGLRADYHAETDVAAKAKLKRELEKLREHIGALAEEARINEFVEDAVRVGIEMRKLENN